MGITSDALRNLDLRITKDNVLFFDMDGTLIDTNWANYLSYEKAIQEVIKSEIIISYNSNERFNREMVKKVFPNLSKGEYEKVIQLKTEFYKEYLHETKLNNLVSEVLIKYCKINKTALVTNSEKDRAIMILEHHGLIDKFSHLLCQPNNSSEKINNKFENAIVSLQISPLSVIVFDNEKTEYDAAILAGIPIENIISINR